MAALLRDLVPQILQHNDEWRLTLLRHWNTIIGTLQTRVRLEKIYDDTLIIGVYESHWMHELHLFSSVLIDSINRYLGHERIAHLRFKLVEEKKQLSKFSLARREVTPVEVVLTPSQLGALRAISDESLKAALLQFWGRCVRQQS